jgi:hypothetical protein
LCYILHLQRRLHFVLKGEGVCERVWYGFAHWCLYVRECLLL